MKTTVCRLVHFYSHAGLKRPKAAIITFVHDDKWVDLTVFGGISGCYTEASVEGNPGTDTRRWEWPPKEPETVEPAIVQSPWGYLGG